MYISYPHPVTFGHECSLLPSTVTIVFSLVNKLVSRTRERKEWSKEFDEEEGSKRPKTKSVGRIYLESLVWYYAWPAR